MHSNCRILASITALSFVCALLAGCARLPLPRVGSPADTPELGGVAVGRFTYPPAAAGRVKPNQIENTAIGDVLLDENVDLTFGRAVYDRLVLAGLSRDDSRRTLSGELQSVVVDDLGFSVSWTLQVRYRINDSAGRAIYEQTKRTQRTTGKFVGVGTAFSEVIKQNVGDLLKDEAFRAAANGIGPAQ